MGGSITLNQVLSVINIFGVVIALIVSLSTLLSKRDSKTIQGAQIETSLSDIKTSVQELRLDAKSILAEQNRLAERVSKVEGRVEMQEKTISRAHARIDDIIK